MAAPQNAPPADQTYKKVALNFFSWYLDGRGQIFWPHRDALDQEILATQIPYRQGGVAAWPGPQEYHLTPDYWAGVDGLQRIDVPEGRVFTQRANRQGPANKREGAKTAATLLARSFRLAHNLRFVKILGWGGQGVAVLFKTLKFTESYFVGKCSLNPDKLHLSDEERRMGRFDRAGHVVRLGPRIDNPIDPDLGRNPDQTLTLNEARPLLMAYYPRGSLEKVLFAAAQRGRNGEKIYDRTLWCIFDCLVQMVVALKYRPKLWTDSGDYSMHNEERIPTDAQQRGLGDEPYWNSGGKADLSEWVHFDIDPGNILVDKYDDAHHRLVPRLRLSDFGLMDDGAYVRAHEETVWAYRTCGKLTWYPPEQFSSEWEYVDDIPGPDAKVAGRYGWRTNLWGVGMVMWCLITRRHPPDAPIPKQVDIEPDWQTPVPDASQQAANPRNLRRSRRAHTRRKVWTYGSEIYGNKRRYLDTDPELRTLVMRCLMDCPDDRPTLRELREIIDRKLRCRWTHRNSDHHTRYGDQAQRLFRDPPAHQRIRDDELLHRWLMGQLDNVDPLRSIGMIGEPDVLLEG